MFPFFTPPSFLFSLSSLLPPFYLFRFDAEFLGSFLSFGFFPTFQSRNLFRLDWFLTTVNICNDHNPVSKVSLQKACFTATSGGG